MFRNHNSRKNNYVRIGLIVIVTLLILIVTITLLAVYLKKKELKKGELDRIECPGFKTKSECTKHGCTYDKVQNGPACFMKKNGFGFTASEIKQRQDGFTAKLISKVESTPYGPGIQNVSLQIDYITENILRIKFLDSNAKRYEVPVQKQFPLLQSKLSVDPNKLKYKVVLSKVESEIFTYQVQRIDGTVLWDTSIGGLVLSDKYLQIASYLPSSFIFGLGEHTRETLRHNLNYSSWPMFSRDRTPERGQINLYGVHPFYTCLENSSKSHGVLLLNSNAMEATLLPAPGISFRTIGGVLDLFYFIGDNPEHVVQLYTSLVGNPVMPPYWGLGFQLSRYGYNNLENVKTAVERTRKASIPQDVQFLDIDHMDGNKDFTYNKVNFSGLLEYIKETQEKYGLKWIIIIDPAIAAVHGYDIYDSGIKNNVFIKRPSFWKKDIFPASVQNVNATFGKVWPKEPVAFPDFFLDETKAWWIKSFVDYHKILPFDGIWIDMNEPANFGTNEEDPEFCKWQHIDPKDCWSLKCPQSPYEDPPYNPLEAGGSTRLSTMTICMESVQGSGSDIYRHYDVHSLYAWAQSVVTLEAAEKSTGTRSLVISRSTYPSSGRYAGHWLGDNRSFWRDMHYSVIGMLEFNLFGIPYIGADVCGFDKDTTPDLCSRWMQVGAFYPFYRNHNGMGMKEQDPAALGEEVARISRLAVERRYRLLPYLYTLFYRAHVDGSTVIRPVFHEFPTDNTTWTIDEQFMWGKCLLISPILREGETSVRAYLPEGEWFLFDYENSTQEKVKQQYIIKTVADYIPIHVRGGCILPTEDIRLRTPAKTEIRNISLYIYPEKKEASGELFVDDGISKGTIKQRLYDLYRYQMTNCNLEIKRESGTAYNGMQPKLKHVIVFNVSNITSVSVDSSVGSFFMDNDSKVLTIKVNMDMKSVNKISWETKENKCGTM